MADKPKREVRLFEPWAPPASLELVHVAAIKALFAGTASDQQQRAAIAFIVNDICGFNDEPFCPGEDGRRSTDYALGKRRVATVLYSILNAPLKNFKDPDAAPTEQG